MGDIQGYIGWVGIYRVELKGVSRLWGQVWGFTQSLPYGSCLGLAFVVSEC